MLTEKEINDLATDAVANMGDIFYDEDHSTEDRGPINVMKSAEAAVVDVIKQALDSVPKVPPAVLGLLRGAQADLDNGDHTSVDQDNALKHAIWILEQLPEETPKKPYTVVMFIRKVHGKVSSPCAHTRTEYVEAVSPETAKETALNQVRLSAGHFDIDVLFVAEGNIENLK